MANHLLHPKFVGAYVYAILVDGVIRYIGKGRRYRATEHFRLAREINERRANGEKVKALRVHNKLAKALREGAKLTYEIISHDLDDKAAYEIEVHEIAVRRDQLWNLHRGGDGGDREMMLAFWKNPEFRKRTSAKIAAGHQCPEYKERCRKATQALWDDPAYHAAQVAREKALWADPEYRAKRIKRLQTVWADPELSRRKSDLVKSQWTPERRAAMAENRRRAWADPEFRARATASIRRSKAKANA